MRYAYGWAQLRRKKVEREIKEWIVMSVSVVMFILLVALIAG